jgi:hypothetical protein
VVEGEGPSQRRPVLVHRLQDGHVSSQRIRRILEAARGKVSGVQLVESKTADRRWPYLHVRQPVLDFVCALLAIVCAY